MSPISCRPFPDLSPNQPCLLLQPTRGWAIIRSIARYPNLIEGMFLVGNWDENTPWPAVRGDIVRLGYVDVTLLVFPLAWGQPLPIPPGETSLPQVAYAGWTDEDRAEASRRELATATKTK